MRLRSLPSLLTGYGQCTDEIKSAQPRLPFRFPASTELPIGKFLGDRSLEEF